MIAGALRRGTRRLRRAVPLPAPVLAAVAAAPLLVGFDFGPVSSCGDLLQLVRLPSGVELCTHGADPAPGTAAGPGDTVASAGTGGTPVPTAPEQCYGDGQDGRRVQVLYAHEAGTPSRASSLDADLRRWVGQVEWTVSTSAAETGGRRHVRFVTEQGATACRVAIAAVTVPAGAFDSFQSTVTALADAGHQRSDRKYLVFADHDAGTCGLATVPNDDRAAADNRANTTVGYARVDADCWRTADQGYYSVAAHELTHTLGGVQPSAPHATTGRHCTDEWDAMCYADGAGVVTTTVCQDTADGAVGETDADNRLLDCGHDDYFHTAPPSGSYLATHWNVASSVFLSHQESTGSGAPSATRDVLADPLGRPTAWSGDLGGAVRPLLADAYGWEACDLPISLLVAEEDATQTVLPLLGSSSTDDVLRTSVTAAAAHVNRAAGTTVLEVASGAWDGATTSEGQLGVRWGQPTGRHHVGLTTRDARIRSAVVTLDASLRSASTATRDLFVLQGLVRALGVGLTDTTGELTSRYPVPGASTTIADRAVRHLYATSCSKDARLDDSLAGPRSQRRDGGTRERIDLADEATTPIAAALDVAAWLTQRRGDRWADRAVVCRDDVHADCLTGTALAGSSGPVLFVPGGPDAALPREVRNALSAALATGARVHVLGGPAAVSDRIVEELRAALPGRLVERIAGEDRFATAAAVAHTVASQHSISQVILARADQPADAVAAGAAAAERGVPVLLTTTAHAPAATQLALTDLGVGTVLVAGGPAAVSDEVVAVLRARGHSVTRMAGRDRFETAVAIARNPALWDRTTVRTSGSVIGLNGGHDQTWNLALASAPVGAYLDAPVLFTTSDSLPSLPAGDGFVGGTLEQMRDLGVTGTAPTVRTVFVGAGRWSTPATAEQFHARVLPGFEGNLTVTAR